MSLLNVGRGAVVRSAVALALTSVVAIAAGAAGPSLHFRVVARTGLRLTDIVWTGRQFLYVENTTNRVMAAGPSGMPLRAFAHMARQVEETRCRPSPAAHGFTPGDIYCHAPDNKIYRISADGKTVSIFATLPMSARSDGALSFDTAGAFGYDLIAATGRSGGSGAGGGSVFAIDAHGHVRRIGRYANRGGADELAIAPSGFGAVAGQVLLAVDAGKKGSLVAMDAHGHTRTLLALPDGPNPIVVLAPHQAPAAGEAPTGLYVTDTLSRDVFFAPGAELQPFAGDVLIGSELHGLFWVIKPIKPRGRAVAATRLSTNLRTTAYNFEGATYLDR